MLLLCLSMRTELLGLAPLQPFGEYQLQVHMPGGAAPWSMASPSTFLSRWEHHATQQSSSNLVQ